MNVRITNKSTELNKKRKIQRGKDKQKKRGCDVQQNQGAADSDSGLGN